MPAASDDFGIETQAQSPLDWTSTTSKVKRTYGGLQRRRKVKNPSPEEASEDRITASVAAGLSNMPEENQVRGLFLSTFLVELPLEVLFNWWGAQRPCSFLVPLLSAYVNSLHLICSAFEKKESLRSSSASVKKPRSFIELRLKEP